MLYSRWYFLHQLGLIPGLIMWAATADEPAPASAPYQTNHVPCTSLRLDSAQDISEKFRVQAKSNISLLKLPVAVTRHVYLLIPVSQSHHHIERRKHIDEMEEWVAVCHAIFFIIVHFLAPSFGIVINCRFVKSCAYLTRSAYKPCASLMRSPYKPSHVAKSGVLRAKIPWKLMRADVNESHCAFYTGGNAGWLDGIHIVIINEQYPSRASSL